MKKIYTLALFAALLSLASCNKEVNPSGNQVIEIQKPTAMVSYTISVTKNEPTKVSVADDGSALWEEGDVIRVYNANEAWDVKGYEATMTSGAGETSATFTFDAPADRNEGFFVTYGAEATLADGKIDIVIPSAVETSAKPILAGYTDTKDEIGEVELEAVAAYLKITLTDDADAVRFFAVNNPNENFAGNIIYEANGSLSTVPSKSSVVVSNPSQTFYVNVLPCAYSLGYIIDVEKGGAHMIKSVSYGESKTLPISSFGKITIPTFAAVSGIEATVSAKTTYSQAVAGQKGTDGEGANNPANTYKVWGGSANLTAVQNISDNLKAHLQPTAYYCDDTEMVNGEIDNLALGSHTVKADYGFVCGDVTIVLAEKVGSGTAHITGLPYENSLATTAGWTSISRRSNYKALYSNDNALCWRGGYVFSPVFSIPSDIETTVAFACRAGGASSATRNIYVAATASNESSFTSSIYTSANSLLQSYANKSLNITFTSENVYLGMYDNETGTTDAYNAWVKNMKITYR